MILGKKLGRFEGQKMKRAMRPLALCALLYFISSYFTHKQIILIPIALIPIVFRIVRTMLYNMNDRKYVINRLKKDAWQQQVPLDINPIVKYNLTDENEE